jgi:hypothetical protein
MLDHLSVSSQLATILPLIVGKILGCRLYAHVPMIRILVYEG